MNILIFYLTLALGISFVCSLLESVFLTITPSYTQLLSKKNFKVGLLVQQLKEKTDLSLSAILTLNTVSHTIGAAGVGAQVLKLYGNQWVAFSSVLLTILILILSEIIPKTIGATYWRQLAPFSAYSIHGLMILMNPFLSILRRISQWVSPKNRVDHHVTREEVIIFAEMGEKHGIIKKREARIIKNLLKLDHIFAEDILTPTSVLFACQKEMTVKEVFEKYPNISFSRIPVFNNGVDDIVGVVHRQKIINFFYQQNESVRLEEFAKEIHVVPHSMSVSSLLDEFIARKEHLFLVVDEYGATMGIITLEDAIETLLGVEIVDEFDSVADMRQLAIEKWEKKKIERQDS